MFYRLRQVRKGAEVRITRSDGKVARYRVEKIEQVPKERFPAERVYTEDGLRLVTCGGVFDRSRAPVPGQHHRLRLPRHLTPPGRAGPPARGAH